MTIFNWFKQMFIHQASTDVNKKFSFGQNLVDDRCIIVNKPSTMSDADAMHCDDRVNKTENSPEKQDTIVIDKFQTCFIDCTCQCEARKLIPQVNRNQCQNIKTQLFEELFHQIRGPSYEIDCCCDCGKKGMRKLKFNYATGDKSANCI